MHILLLGSCAEKPYYSANFHLVWIFVSPEEVPILHLHPPEDNEALEFKHL